MIPGNVNDLIQAARDGELGLVDQVKIGDLVVSALIGLDDPTSSQIAQHKVQTGSVLAYSVTDERDTISLSIMLANPDYSVDGALTAAATGSAASFTDTWRDKKKQLYEIKSTRTVVDVQTHEELYSNCLVQAIYPEYDVDENWDCFFATVVVERIDFWGATQNTDSLLASGLEVVSGL